VIGLGLVLAGTVIVMFAASQAVDFGVFNLRFHWLDADRHLSIFGIASLLAQAATAAACVLHARVVMDRPRAWLALGLLLGVLIPIRALTAFNASVLAVPLACVFALLFVLTWHSGTSRRIVWVALLLLALSLLLHKVGLDADSSTASDYTWSYQTLGIIKHGAELAGWILAATGVAADIAAAPVSPER